jgi:hypothetical protein
MQARITFRCKQCGKLHEGLPAITYDSPTHYHSLTQEERERRGKLSQDLCAIANEAGDGHTYYVRTVLRLPIVGEAETLEWGVWGSLSKENFERYVRSFEDHDQSKLGPLFSWFASRLAGYPDTLGLRSNVLPQDNRKRPFVDFDPEQDHPLVRDKIDGISLDRAIELAMPLLHKH